MPILFRPPRGRTRNAILVQSVGDRSITEPVQIVGVDPPHDLGRYSNACDITAAANALAGDGHPIDTDDLATISPYITHTIRRFGDWVLDLSPPDAVPVTTLDLVPGALFPGDITAATAPRRMRQRVTSKTGS